MPKFALPERRHFVWRRCTKHLQVLRKGKVPLKTHFSFILCLACLGKCSLKLSWRYEETCFSKFQRTFHTVKQKPSKSNAVLSPFDWFRSVLAPMITKLGTERVTISVTRLMYCFHLFTLIDHACLKLTRKQSKQWRGAWVDNCGHILSECCFLGVKLIIIIPFQRLFERITLLLSWLN